MTAGSSLTSLPRDRAFYVADPNGEDLDTAEAASFSSPISGMAACLWQANPSFNNIAIADAIRQSASQYLYPDEELGYGIPDFVLANNILTVIDGPDDASIIPGSLSNPFRDVFAIDCGKQAAWGAWQILLLLKLVIFRPVNCLTKT